MGLYYSKGPSGFSGASTAEEVTQGIDAAGLSSIVTGTTHGIGKETARVLALRGAHVVMAVRNVNAGNKVKEEILSQIPNAKIGVMHLDLSSFASIRKFASEYIASGRPLHLLINNAGTFPSNFSLTEDNIELNFATNHVGPFLLTYLLLDTMKKTARESKREGRIVNVSSMGHSYATREGFTLEKINDRSGWYNPLRAYGHAKLGNILLAKELTRLFKEEGVNITANAVHPGGVNTNGIRSGGGIRVIMQGASTTCYAALHPQLKGVSGEYLKDSNIFEPSPLAKDEDLAKKVWDFTLSLTNS
ncbi:hypothetical protein K2173_022641 [Erythroxylum novogranatense]|uniref:Uncharacterized protein n=1 Tax=Erythroxylum novogranatense TaxID=1862640 RepID=A0AAV8TNL6_9ROSI|nr:hypothetical protein K2173_022641 [Erythroxylum novogranatense]